MKKQPSSRSGLLLMETIFAILSFSVASAICLEAFVKAHTLVQDTRELDMAVRQSCSAAALLDGTDDPMGRIQEAYPDAAVDGGFATIYYSEDFKPCAEAAASYHLDISPTPVDGQTTTYSVTVYKSSSSDEIYHLEITAYRQYTL